MRANLEKKIFLHILRGCVIMSENFIALRVILLEITLDKGN